jgi:hypothetical protein
MKHGGAFFAGAGAGPVSDYRTAALFFRAPADDYRAPAIRIKYLLNYLIRTIRGLRQLFGST